MTTTSQRFWLGLLALLRCRWEGAGAAAGGAAGERGVAQQRGEEDELVAVCLRGNLQGGPEVLQSIEKHVLRALHADTFVYMALREETDEEPRRPTPQDLARLSVLPGLRSLHMEVEDVTALLESEVRQRHKRPSDAERVLEMTRGIGGNWLGGLREFVPSGAEGSGGEWRTRAKRGLPVMLSWHRCLGMVEREEAARGREYDWIVSTRLDSFWEFPHVPLRLLTMDAIWVPEGMDFGGLNDRHAVIPRRGAAAADGKLSPADLYLGAWRFVAEGKAAFMLRGLLAQSSLAVEDTGCDPEIDGSVAQPCVNQESWLSMRLKAQEMGVKRLPPLSWVVCPSIFHAPRRFVDPRVQECQTSGLRFKWEKEFQLAKDQLQCLWRQLESWNWSATPHHALAAIRECWCPTTDGQVSNFFALCAS